MIHELFSVCGLDKGTIIILKIDRKFSGSRRAVIHQRRCKVPDRGGELTFRMILDRFSVEVFVNDGEQTLTATMFTDPSADGICFLADGEVCMDVEKYDLNNDSKLGVQKREKEWYHRAGDDDSHEIPLQRRRYPSDSGRQAREPG